MMQQETIVHFVCFITDMQTEEFTAEWEGYAKALKINKAKAIFYKQIKAGKNSYGYIAKFELPEEDFQLPTINERKPGLLAESRIRALQMGGYTSVKQEQAFNTKDKNTTVMVFVQHNENDIAFYQGLPFYSQLSIHQAYYENSNYGYIMEFIVPEQHAVTLMEQLEKRPLVTAAAYKTILLHKPQRVAATV